MSFAVSVERWSHDQKFGCALSESVRNVFYVDPLSKHSQGVVHLDPLEHAVDCQTIWVALKAKIC